MSTARDGARAVLPMAAVIAVIGVLLGHEAREAGFSVLAAATMSATTFAGGAQFAAISLLRDGGTVMAALVTGAALNARYLLMGATLAGVAQGDVLRRLLLGHLTVDESWGVAYTTDGRFSRARLVGAGALLLVVHVASTAAGAAMGTMIDNPDELGLDAAVPALFLLLLWPRLRERDGAVAAIAGAVMALVLTPLTPPGIPILGAAVAAIARAPRRGAKEVAP